MEIFIFARFQARSGAETEVEAALREVVPPSRAEAGCMSLHVFRSIRDSQVFYIHSRWKDEAAFNEHARLPHTTKFIERVEPVLDHRVEAQQCQLLI
ncbi:MAG: putative quinol monooxygenase [Candidatus Korobacteraceae bacterium]